MTTDQDVFARPSIFAGAKAPQGVTCTIVPGKRRIDLSLVTSVRLVVRAGSQGDETIWTTTIVKQRVDRLTVRHDFDAYGSETQDPGRYRIVPELVFHQEPVPPATDPIPDGVVRCAAFYLGVKP